MSRRLIVALCFGAAVVGCALTRPQVKSMYIGEGTPVPRADSSQVDVFLRSDPPKREYQAIGEVEVTTGNKSRQSDSLLVYARQAARKLGGDALILEVSTQATGDAYSYPVRNLYTGKVMGYATNSREVRILRGSVIVWKGSDSTRQ